VLRSWTNKPEGLQAKLDCVVHADPPAEVNDQWFKYEENISGWTFEGLDVDFNQKRHKPATAQKVDVCALTFQQDQTMTIVYFCFY